MSLFCPKKINPPIRVGTLLKQERERQQKTLEETNTATHIPTKYLLAIENGNFDELPPIKTYRLAYLREYAKFLNLEPKIIIHQFKKESGLEGVIQKHPNKIINFSSLSSFPFLVRNIIIAGLVILFAGYLIWQIKGIINPPLLEVYSPPEGFITSALNIAVQGDTEPECRLTVNGQEVRPNDKGHFEANVDLSAGVNTITISAIKKHGKTTTETRHVVVRER